VIFLRFCRISIRNKQRLSVRNCLAGPIWERQKPFPASSGRQTYDLPLRVAVISVYGNDVDHKLASDADFVAGVTIVARPEKTRCSHSTSCAGRLDVGCEEPRISRFGWLARALRRPRFSSVRPGAVCFGCTPRRPSTPAASVRRKEHGRVAPERHVSCWRRNA
jgi:hypothetical protein